MAASFGISQSDVGITGVISDASGAAVASARRRDHQHSDNIAECLHDDGEANIALESCSQRVPNSDRLALT